jgi:membrane-bound serine protease (ClpP class)
LRGLRAAALGLVLVGFGLAAARVRPSAPAERPVVVLDVAGAVGPATAEYLRQGLRTARDRRAELVVIRMDTPGGLESSTHDIVRDILASPVPVATFVAPAGARAASAGTYILYASHLAAMAPGTHLGAATPVAIGGGGLTPPPGDEGKGGAAKKPDAMEAKTTNDAVAWIAALAALHGRNAAWAEQAVRQAATLTAEAALKARVIELVASDVGDLTTKADGRMVKLAGAPRVLHTAGRPVLTIAPDWRAQFLGVITDPNIAYLLLLVGVYGLIFEVLSPGAVAPGVIGAIALFVGLFALNLLPVNYAGLGLVLLGLGLFVAEAHAPSGVLAAGGTIALGLGSLLLFNSPLPEFRLSPAVALVAAGLTLAFFTLALGTALRSRRLRPTTGGQALLGARARVVSWSGDQGFVHLAGEDWQARAARPLRPGEGARVVARDGLTLVLEPEESPPTHGAP